MYVVYALVDPRDEAVHYVGFTEDVYRRFLEHIQGSGTNYEKNKWVFDMREANIMIQMRHLEETEDIEHARIREEYWIKHYKMLKDPLSNMKNVHIKNSISH